MRAIKFVCANLTKDTKPFPLAGRCGVEENVRARDAELAGTE
jgi:hypothetical protein